VTGRVTDVDTVVGMGICFIVVMVMFLWAAISPKSMWWTLSAWRYRDPEANEPSDAAYLMSRISGIVIVAGAAIAFVVAGVRNTDW
jgi:hypothetical protein